MRCDDQNYIREKKLCTSCLTLNSLKTCLITGLPLFKFKLGAVIHKRQSNIRPFSHYMIRVDISQQLLIGNLGQHVAVCISLLACSTSHAMFWNDGMRKSIISVNRYKVCARFCLGLNSLAFIKCRSFYAPELKDNTGNRRRSGWTAQE